MPQKETQKPKAEKCCNKSCIKKIIFPAILAILLFVQLKQIKKSNTIIDTIRNAIRSEICTDFQEDTERHFKQKELDNNFNVKFATKTVSENDFIENLLNSMNVTTSEKYLLDPLEYERRENQYGPLIERGFENDERFYIKLSSPEVGYGLFANVDILPNSVIGVYHGTLTQVKAGLTDTDYAWDYGTFPNPENPEESVEICIDGRTYGTWLRFVNHKNDAEANCYAMYVPYNNRWYIIYLSRNFIPKDSELFASYGDNYWNARAETHNLEENPEKAYNEEL